MREFGDLLLTVVSMLVIFFIFLLVCWRDKLAAELAEVYPPLAAKLADLAARVATNDAAIERVKQKLPDGKEVAGQR